MLGKRLRWSNRLNLLMSALPRSCDITDLLPCRAIYAKTENIQSLCEQQKQNPLGMQGKFVSNVN